jgi:hypothetical protein
MIWPPGYCSGRVSYSTIRGFGAKLRPARKLVKDQREAGNCRTHDEPGTVQSSVAFMSDPIDRLA